MSITYGNITVEGIPFTRILQLHITHQPNEHGCLTIVGELRSQDAPDTLQRLDETTLIKVKAKIETDTDTKTNANTSDSQEQPLFTGRLLRLTTDNAAEYTLLTIQGVSTSYSQDIKKQSRSYQNTGKTYEDILNQAYAGNGQVHVSVTDKAIGAFILQLDETNWEFTKRMASRFNAPVIASLVAPEPLVYVGLPPTGQTKTITSASYRHGAQDDAYHSVTQNYLAEGSNAMRQDFAALTAQSFDYVFLGDKINLNNSEYLVKSVQADLVDGVLEMQYQLTTPTGFVAPIQSNLNCSGKILTGQVRAVKQDLVQVHLVDIDPQYDSSGDWWFPYSTVYSSKDGSGWYVMPESGDYIRVMFPSHHEAGGFAASSVNQAPLDNPVNKSFKAPSGKELLMTDEGIFIICNNQKVFIDLTKENGINIVADQNINIMSSTKIIIQSTKDLQLLAEKQVYLGTPSSFITITPEQISMAAKNVIIT